MVSFRKASLAFAGCVLMGASAAYAQTLDCAAPSAPFNTLRQEALTQVIGPVVVSCSIPATLLAPIAGATADITIETDGGFVFTNKINSDDVVQAVTLTVAGTPVPTGTLASDGKSITWTGANLNALLAAYVDATPRDIVFTGLHINANMVASGSTPKVRVTLTPYDTGVARITVPSTLGEVGRVQTAVAFSGKNVKSVDCGGVSAPSTADQGTAAKINGFAYIMFAENYSRAFAVGDKLTARFKVPAGTKLYVATSAFDFGDAPAWSVATTVEYGDGSEDPNSFVELKKNDDGIYEGVWTITAATNNKDKFMIPVFMTASAGAVAPGNLTAVGSLGPFSDVTTATSKAEADVPDVRFVIPTDDTDPIYAFTNCTQVLLFPYATNVGNWDTGIAISNISADMKNADDKWAGGGDDPKSGQKGKCTLYFVGDNAPAKAIETADVEAGKTLTFMVSSKAEGFNGYLKAQCDFSSKGFAFMSSSDLGGVGVGYVAQEGVPLVQ